MAHYVGRVKLDKANAVQKGKLSIIHLLADLQQGPVLNHG
jgi:hypothetical protein